MIPSDSPVGKKLFKDLEIPDSTVKEHVEKAVNERGKKDIEKYLKILNLKTS